MKTFEEIFNRLPIEILPMSATVGAPPAHLKDQLKEFETELQMLMSEIYIQYSTMFPLQPRMEQPVMLNIIRELLPSKVSTLNKIGELANYLFEAKWIPPQGTYSTESSVNLIHSAVENKKHMLANNETLDSQLQEFTDLKKELELKLETEKSEQEAKQQVLEQKGEKVKVEKKAKGDVISKDEMAINSLERKIKVAADDIEMIREVNEVIAQMNKLFDRNAEATPAHPNEKGLARIADTILMLNELILRLPKTADKDGTLSGFIEALQTSYNVALKKKSELGSDNPELKKYIDICKNISIEDIRYLSKALGEQMNSVVTTTPTFEYKAISDNYANLIKLSRQLIESNDTEFNDLVTQFSSKYIELSDQIFKAPHSDNAVQHAKSATYAAHYSEIEFPLDQYTIFLSGADLRKSENQEIRNLQRNNPIRIDNPNEYILSGSNNITNLMIDVERNVKLNGKAINLEDNEELKRFSESKHSEDEYAAEKIRIFMDILIKEFGKEAVPDLIKHYDQSLTALTVATINSSVGEKSNESIIIMPNSRKAIPQNIYKKGDTIFRDVAVTEVLIYIPTTSNENNMGLSEEQRREESTWHFKANIKALSWLSPAGFVVQNIGTNSPIIANSLMKNNNVEELRALIRIIGKFEKELSAKNDRLEQGSISKKKGKHKEIVKETEKLITSFKTGGITLDEFTTAIIEKTKEAFGVPHASIGGQIKGTLFGTTTGTYSVLEKIQQKLIKFKETSDGEAIKYARKPEDQKVEPFVRPDMRK